MDQNDEAQLIEDILDGEAEAYAVLVRRYQGPIHALMARMCGDGEDARDLTQETFVVAYEKLDRFKCGARFFPWLYTIGLNLGRDHLRKKRHCEISSADLPEGFMENISDGLTSERLADWMDANTLVLAMDSLGLSTREALLLRYQEGMSINDISSALGLSVSAVKMRIARGLDRLRSLFVARGSGHAL
ncbi:RNA polymerase, sigma-24 subunit, ECF subfamily [Solidesulfovibrio carbinoliphilus subsp. oakridgensis]|uniref:RNA polymerase, sigma-24 subunit, ECF subfamily n=1 Tax=Solidesulfovibrio carbinoliphilus subsp. oakridgensis TaxID=694327 RepID=G7Q636_9BACT|nr:sigma-70 family RNA polymerase sigma factor [Solidesulfovibrio carbinoliphilus]EHJ47052.1 RNA polymerase, sigma-24 subunit, ECF subfamily [Solidesulfovibrio carbinoliphilus subsp. oakridgensis]